MTSVSSIALADFKKFTHFTVSCREANVLVGPNNAGKSSILDALRLLADLMRLARRESPQLREQAGIGVCATYVLPTSSASIPIGNVVRNYGDDFARIEFKLATGRAIHMRLHPTEGMFAYLVTDGNPPRTAQSFRNAVDLDLVVVPTLSALEEEENFVTDVTVRRNEATRLASRNFRNIVHRLSNDEFALFGELWTCLGKVESSH